MQRGLRGLVRPPRQWEREGKTRMRTKVEMLLDELTTAGQEFPGAGEDGGINHLGVRESR